MTQKRSDALQALVAEVVDLEADLTLALGEEEEARVESVAARQALDAQMVKRVKVEERLATTRGALDLIAGRDLISDETLAALRKRAGRAS